MSTRHQQTRPADEALTFEALATVGGLDRIDPVPHALAQLAAARQAEAEAAAAYVDAQQSAGSDPDPRARRLAQRSLDDRRIAILDAKAELAQVVRDLAAANRTAFDRCEPVIRAAHQRLLPRVDAALRELETAAEALRDVERLACDFRVSGALADRTAVPADQMIAERIIGQITYWREVLGRLRSSAAA